jgi:hypothetical protein
VRLFNDEKWRPSLLSIFNHLSSPFIVHCPACLKVGGAVIDGMHYKYADPTEALLL